MRVLAIDGAPARVVAAVNAALAAGDSPAVRALLADVEPAQREPMRPRQHDATRAEVRHAPR